MNGKYVVKAHSLIYYDGEGKVIGYGPTSGRRDPPSAYGYTINYVTHYCGNHLLGAIWRLIGLHLEGYHPVKLIRNKKP